MADDEAARWGGGFWSGLQGASTIFSSVTCFLMITGLELGETKFGVSFLLCRVDIGIDDP